MVFTKLPAETAGPFIRQVFPWYFAAVAGVLAVAGLALLSGSAFWGGDTPCHGRSRRSQSRGADAADQRASGSAAPGRCGCRTQLRSAPRCVGGDQPPPDDRRRRSAQPFPLTGPRRWGRHDPPKGPNRRRRSRTTAGP
ncbi:MAG: hypothetical protein AAF371_03140 [Pseudomonadota bacterium]